jgi:hypothetical protein
MESELGIMSFKNIQYLRNNEDIRTPRLDLIAIALPLLQCEMEGGAAFVASFRALAGVEIPPQWPPQDWEPHVLDYVLQQLTAQPETLGWTRYITLRRSAGISALRICHRGPRRDDGLGAVARGSEGLRSADISSSSSFDTRVGEERLRACRGGL